MCAQLLLVEDDPDLANLAALHLRDDGHEVEIVGDGLLASKRVAEQKFDLILLDLMLPGMDGLQICQQIRAADDFTPLIILTAKTSEVDRVLGLEFGADDYLSKPFSLRELMARVKAALRRSNQYAAPAADVDGDGGPGESGSSSAGSSTDSQALEFVGLVINRDHREVKIDGTDVELTAKEFDLLWHFASHPGRVYTRADLLADVWGYGYDGFEHTVNSHINRLRNKIETDASEPRWIHTVWGVGYKFVAPNEEGEK
jgi:two-component system, OmpR family, response regulator